VSMKNSDDSVLLQELLNSIDENGELPFQKRRWLQQSLKGMAAGGKENVVWLALEAICAHKVQHIWEEQIPSERAPVDLLSAADRCLVNAGNAEALSPLMPEVKSVLDNKLLLGPDYFQAVYAGFACWAAARNVVYGTPDHLNQFHSELEFDPELWDACFYASLACAGGAVWEEGVGNSHERREFWNWFIVEAVPQAISFHRTPH
jgi:hypothetical protein